MGADKIAAVTGATGLIGRRLLRRLHQDGFSLRVLTRVPSAFDVECEHIQGDLTSLDSVFRLLEGASHVVHLGGVAHTNLRSPANKERARAVNVGGTRNLLDAADKFATGRVIITSSAHVYAGQRGVDLAETAPVGSDSTYAGTKLAVEALAADAQRAGRDVLVIRPCITYGPGVRFNLQSLLKGIRRGYYFHINGVDPVRSFLSVDVAAAAISHLLTKAPAGTYNIADREPVHLVGWVNHLADLMQVRRPRTIPFKLLSSAATLLSPVAKMGISVPLNRDALDKLAVSFSLDIGALEKTGFVWPANFEEVLKEMVEAS